MLEIQRIRTSKEAIALGLKKRNIDALPTLNQILDLDTEWRTLKGELDQLGAEANKIAKEIGGLMKEGKHEEANQAKSRTAEIKSREQEVKQLVSDREQQITELLYTLPNVPQDSVPNGFGAEDNEVVVEVGSKANLPQGALPHWDLAAKYNLIDFEMGVKVTGAGFPFYRGKGAKLQRALINFFLNEADNAGYEEFIPPHVVNEASGYGTGTATG
jgi:seryl-tRNA synthetase